MTNPLETILPTTTVDGKSNEWVATTRELTGKSILVSFAATLGMMTSSPPIVSGPQGLLLVPVTHAFGIGRGTLALLAGISLLLGAALTPLVGQAIDRYGVRRIVLPGILFFGLVQMLFAGLPISTPMLAFALLLQGVAFCLVTPLAYTRVISLWFQRRRGLVLGVASAIGIGGGSGACVGLVSVLLAHGGWRAAYFGTGVYVIVVGALVILPFLHEPVAIERAEQSALLDLPGITLREAFGTTAFKLIMVLVICCVGGVTIMMSQGPALLAGRGLDLGPAYLGCAALGSVSGQIVSGILLDRIDSPKVGLIFSIANFIGGAAILYFGTTTALVLPSAVLMGVGQGAETGLASYYVSRFCGLRSYGSIFGVVMTLITLSAGVCPTVAGYVYDTTGSYDAMLPYMLVLLAIPSFAIAFMPAYRFKAVLSIF